VDSISAWLRILDSFQVPTDGSVVELAPSGDDTLSHALAQRNPRASLAKLSIPPSVGVRAALAAQVRDQIAPLSTHLIAIRHAVDDIVDATIARHEGLGLLLPAETRQAAVVRAVRAYWRSGDLERVVAPELVGVVGELCPALRPAGRLVFSHEVVDSDLRLGQPLDLYVEYIPLTRRWLAGADLPLQEIALDGFDPHWWLFLKRAQEP